MFTVKVLIIGILSFILTLFLPWYTVAVVAFFTGVFLSNKPGNNFLAGFFGVGLFWLAYTLYLDIFNDHVLSTKIAALFAKNLGSAITSPVMIIVTTLLGGILGGLASFSGALIMDDGSKARLRKAVKNGRYTLKI